ncbi:hypothetical protein ABT099_30235 [Streptomyces prasinus]|uniref:hypothetical protein n=1 Tax=Streptomyces prasinus TaxID=67345 RepID=UPI003328B076
MDRKRLVLPAVLTAAAAVVAALTLWPDPKDDLRGQNLCWGSLTEKTAGLLNDGEAGRTSDDVMDAGSGKPVEDDRVFGTVCTVIRKDPGGETYREQYALTAAAGDATTDAPKGATPLGDGHEGWLTLRSAVLRLSDGCVSAMRSDSRYGELTLSVAPRVTVHERWDAESVIPRSRTVLLESAANLAKQYDCAVRP